MRILQLTDTHLGSRWGLPGAPPDLRARDHALACELALAPALRGEVDLVVHSGDLFDRSAPDRDALAAAHRLFGAVARRVPVVVLPGNHDRRGLSASLGAVTGVTVADAPTRHDIGGFVFATLPYHRDAAAFAAARRALGAVDWLVVHQAFDGHRVPTFRFRVGAQVDTIGAEHLEGHAGPVATGHLHPRQVVRVGECEVVCPGSTERTAFSEAPQTKGYARWAFSGSAWRWAFVDLPSRPLLQVGSEEELDAVVPGAVVRASPRWEAAIRARGAWVSPTRAQLPLFSPRPSRAAS